MNKRKRQIRSTMPLPRLRIVAGETRALVCQCGHTLERCLVGNCALPAHSWTVQEVAAMEEKLRKLSLIGTSEDMLEIPDKDDEEYLAGWSECAFYLLKRIRSVLEEDSNGNKDV